MNKPKISKHYKRIAEVYKQFVPSNITCSFTDEDLVSMYEYETHGKGDLGVGVFTPDKVFNGYAIGKKFMDVTISMWREDIAKGLLYKFELYDHFPKWFIDSKVGDVQQGCAILDDIKRARFIEVSDKTE